jgi:hypothetical protein
MKTVKAPATGRLYKLSERFNSLAQAQTIYPFAVSLDESIDRCSIQLAINQQCSQDNTYAAGAVYIPPGHYYIDRPIKIPSILGLYIFGDSPAATQLHYHGGQELASIDPAALFWMESCQECHIGNLLLHDDAQNPGWTAVLMSNAASTPYGVVSTGNLFRRLRVERFSQGFTIAGGVGGDVNNDSHIWEDCTIDQCSSGVVVAGSSQAHFLRFNHVGFNGGTYGIWCKYGCYTHCHQCTFNGQDTAIRQDDFFPGVCTMEACNGENLRRAWSTHFQGGHGPLAPIKITDCRFAFNLLPGDYCLDFNHEGPVHIVGNHFESINSNAPLVALRFGQPRGTHRDNVYAYSGSWGMGAIRFLDGATPAYFYDEGNSYVDMSNGGITIQV